MKKVYHFIIQLVTNSTGVSVKNFMLLWGALIATIIAVNILCFEWYLLLHPEVTYRPNYYGMSLVITAIGTMVGAVVWGKVKAESYEWRMPKKDDESDTPSLNEEDGL